LDENRPSRLLNPTPFNYDLAPEQGYGWTEIGLLNQNNFISCFLKLKQYYFKELKKLDLILIK